MFKVRKKPIAAARKNAQVPDIMMEYFKTYTEVVIEFGILPEDQWNFDETGYRMGMGREDWVVSVDVIQISYSKCPDNRESLTAMGCISVGRDIPPMFIITGIQQLVPWFNNDLDYDIAVTTAETGCTNHWISLNRPSILKILLQKATRRMAFVFDGWLRIASHIRGLKIL